MDDFSSFINDWLDQHPPTAKEAEFDDEPRRRAALRRTALKRLKPQATLDLHGLTVAEALQRADRFLKESKTRGLQKVLVIHGKGLHSQAPGGILKKAVREHIKNHALSGETGIPEAALGGDGAFWVILR